MANTYSAVTTGFNVLDPNNLDGTPLFSADSTGVYSNGILIESNTDAAAVAAAVGGGQSGATALTASYNLVTTVTSNFDSVKLPVPAGAGVNITIKNTGASILSVFPSTGLTINGLAANLSVDIPIGGDMVFTASSLTAWRTPIALFSPSPTTQTGNLVLKATASAGNTQTIITNASQAAARTYTVPDAGTNASFVMGAGTQTVAGATTFTLAVPISATTNQLVLGTTNTTTISSTAPAGSRTYTIADAGGADTFAMLAATQTLTGKTINGAIYSTDNAVASATLTLNSSATLTNVVGMAVTVVPGTYRFRVDAPCVSTANTGIKVGFKLTTTVITSGAIAGIGFSAAACNMSAYSTTVTDQALWYDTTAGVELKLQIDGTLVIGTGGTMQFQMGQHTSHADSTSIFAGAYMSFTRIA